MGQPLSVRAAFIIVLSAGTPPPTWGWVVDLEAVPGPSSQVRSYLFPPCTACAACLWGPSCPSAEALQTTPGLQSAGTVVIIAILSVLLAVLLTALLGLLVYTW